VTVSFLNDEISLSIFGGPTIRFGVEAALGFCCPETVGAVYLVIVGVNDFLLKCVDDGPGCALASVRLPKSGILEWKLETCWGIGSL